MAYSLRTFVYHSYTYLPSTISATQCLAGFPRDDMDCDFAVFVPDMYATTLTL